MASQSHELGHAFSSSSHNHLLLFCQHSIPITTLNTNDYWRGRASPSSDWILHENFRDALWIIRCQMFFFTLRGTTGFFLGWWWWHWREPVVIAVPISIFLMPELSLVISALDETSCWVRKTETYRHGKGRKNFQQFLWNKLDSCVQCEDLRRTLHLCSKLWSPKALLHHGWAPSALDTPYGGCPCYDACWQEQWRIGREDKSTAWGCCNFLWNLIGNKIRFDRKYIYRLFNCITLQLLWVVSQQQWGAQVKPCCVRIA